MIRQRSPEWYEARRKGVTSTDMVAILGLSRYASEGDVAREKLGQEMLDEGPEAERRMRLGREMENLIRVEDEIEHGVKLRRVSRLVAHPDHPWALTSLDFERVGERTIVETKASASRRWNDGLPEEVEVQVRWQMGVARYPRAHVAALRYGSSLACFDLDHDEATFDRMLTIGVDFMSRLVDGGPFDESHASVRRAFPLDDGTAVVADAQLVEAVADLIATKRQLGQLWDKRDALETAIQTRMGPASLLVGPDFRVSWRRAKGSTHVKWEELAEQLLADFPDQVQAAMITKHSESRAGSRRFLVREETR